MVCQVLNEYKKNNAEIKELNRQVCNTFVVSSALGQYRYVSSESCVCIMVMGVHQHHFPLAFYRASVRGPT